MKFSADFRRIAREALRGNWMMAIITAFVASFIGANVAEGGGFSIDFSSDSESTQPFAEYFGKDLGNLVWRFFGGIFIIAVFMWLVMILIGGAGKLGYARYNLNLIDGRSASISDLFSQFGRWVDGLIMIILMKVFVFLWSLLFVIPGIIKSYSYSMTPYILYENPEMSPNAAITESRRIMDGNKIRLFCLHLSFIGWSLICGIPAAAAGILMLTGSELFLAVPLIVLSAVFELVLQAYIEAAQAAFYREISYPMADYEITVEL